jgi:hypothetical protein
VLVLANVILFALALLVNLIEWTVRSRLRQSRRAANPVRERGGVTLDGRCSGSYGELDAPANPHPRNAATGVVAQHHGLPREEKQ